MNKARNLRLNNWLISVIASIFVLILIILPAHAFISTWGGTAIGPLEVWKSWKEILLATIIPLVAIYLWFNPVVFKVLWSRLVNKLILAYVGLNLVFAVLSQASLPAVAAGLLMNLRFFAMFLVAQLIVESNHPWAQKIKDRFPKIILGVTVFVASLGILQTTVIPADFLANFGYDKDQTIAPYILVDENPDALRAFGTLRGPNELGSYIILPLLLALALLIKKRQKTLASAALIVGAVGLFLTHSRSAWVGFVAALIILAIAWIPRPQIIKWLKWGTAPVILVMVLFLWLATTVPALRLAIFHSSPGDPSLFEGSTENHWQATKQGIEDILANPAGSGVGTAGPASYYNTSAGPRIAENYFVQIGQEIGLLGLILLLAIHVILIIKMWQNRQNFWPKVLLASFVGLIVINTFLHTWADDPTAMTWWAVAGLFLFNKEDER